MKSFELQVAAHTAKYRRRCEAVFKLSVQEVAVDASRQVAEGGRMRVDTGFLRNSIRAEIGALPAGPSSPRYKGDPNKQGATGEVSLVIAQARLGDVVYVGWTANYARFREYYDGFMSSAVQKWSRIVRKNNNRARALFK